MNRISDSYHVSTIFIFIQKKVCPIHFLITSYRLPDAWYRSPEAQYKAQLISARDRVENVGVRVTP